MGQAGHASGDQLDRNGVQMKTTPIKALDMNLDPPYETPAPEINYTLNDEYMVITAIGEGAVTLYIRLIDNDTGGIMPYEVQGYGFAEFAIPRGEDVMYVTVWAVAQADGDAIPGMSPVDYYVEIPPIVNTLPEQTPMPEISWEAVDDGVMVTVSGEGHICLYCESVLIVEGFNYVTWFIPYGEYDEEYNIMASAVQDGMLMSEYAVASVFVPAKIPYETPAPEINYTLNDEYMVITAIGEGAVTLYIRLIDNDTGGIMPYEVQGYGFAEFAIPRGEDVMYVTVWAVAQADGDAIPGMSPVDYYVEIPPIVNTLPEQTPMPEISWEAVDDGVMVTVSGEGHICLYCESVLIVEGFNYVTWFIPYGECDEEYNIMASAEQDGMLMSEYVVASVFVPAKVEHPKGDIDGDGKVSISDVAGLIEYLLSHEGGDDYMVVADINQDGKVSITDVTALIEYLLNGTW